LTGEALKMTLELRELRRKHGMENPLKPLPLLPPLQAPHGVLIKALASDSSVDLDRGRFAPGSIKLAEGLRLLLRHNPEREVGEIIDVDLKPNGDVVVDALITDPSAANLPGLSIGATVRKFSTHDAESRTGFRCEVEDCTVSEISLTEHPANLRCTVQERRPVEPFDLSLLAWRRSVREGYAIMRKQLDVIGRMADQVQQLLESAPKAPPAAPQRKRYATREWAIGDRINLDASLVADADSDVADGTIKGVASAPGTDAYGHRVMPHAFTHSIQRKGLTGPRGVKLLAFHDWAKPAGVIKKLETDAKGQLRIEAQLNLNVTYARDLWAIAKQNEGLSFSVGFILQEFELVDEKSAKEGEGMRITRGELLEVSVVLAPAQPDSVMTFVNQRPETIAEFEKSMIASGWAGSRNEAQRITEFTKKNLHLFA
jgi:HK97 family phage prohead protease